MSKIEKQANGKLKVTWTTSSGGPGGEDEFDTVLAAVGRYADTKSLGLDKAGVTVDKKGKIPCTNEQTNVPHIYAVGDVVEGKPELTPVAIQCGRLLVRRLFGQSKKLMDYTDVATAVFTPPASTTA